MKSQLKQVLRPLKPYLPAVSPVPSWQHGFRLLQRYGFEPNTIFDIGVGFGTPELYHAFPQAFYYLFDPTPESLDTMRKLARRLRCEVLNLALGDHDGEAELEIRPDIQGSTLFEECGPRAVLRRETVPMRRFDALVGRIERPSLAKIDVQGAEMLVLEGMTGRLAEIDALIVETSTIATLKDGPELCDVVRFMQEHGFVVFDILGLKRRPLDGATAQFDLLFVPQYSRLRADHRWASAG